MGMITNLLVHLRQVLAAQDPDGNAVVQKQLLGPRARHALYAKHMAKHKVGLDSTIFKRASHVVGLPRVCRRPRGRLE